MAVSCQLSQFSSSREPSSQLVRLLIDDVPRECLAKLASWKDIVGGIELSVNSFSFQEVCRIQILYVQCFKADNYKDDFQNLAPFSIILRLTDCGWRACRFKTHIYIADRSMALTNANQQKMGTAEFEQIRGYSRSRMAQRFSCQVPRNCQFQL